MNHYYLDAAERLHISCTSKGEHQYACSAIFGAVLGSHDCVSRHKSLFADYFRPAHVSMHYAWFGLCYSSQSEGPTKAQTVALLKNKERRVFALLFMHEITKGTEV